MTLSHIVCVTNDQGMDNRLSGLSVVCDPSVVVVVCLLLSQLVVDRRACVPAALMRSCVCRVGVARVSRPPSS